MGFETFVPLIGSAVGAIGASNAADAGQAGAEGATAEQKRQYDLTRSDSLKQYEQVRTDQAPYRQIGNSALQRLSQGMGYSPTRTLRQASAPAAATTQNEAAIRASLLPQFTTPGTPARPGIASAREGSDGDLYQPEIPARVDYAGLEAAVRAQMGPGGTQTLTQGEDGVYGTDPNAAGFGDLSRNFTIKDYYADPGYQFRLSQGEQGIKRAAAARGGQYSGATLKALANFNSGLASQEYGNAYSRFNTDQTTQFNRNAALAGIGQTANTAVGNAGNATNSTLATVGMNSANQIGNNMGNAGEARASGYVGGANAIGSGIRQAYNNYSQNEALKNYGAPSINNYQSTRYPVYDTADYGGGI